MGGEYHIDSHFRNADMGAWNKRRSCKICLMIPRLKFQFISLKTYTLIRGLYWIWLHVKAEASTGGATHPKSFGQWWVHLALWGLWYSDSNLLSSRHLLNVVPPECLFYLEFNENLLFSHSTYKVQRPGKTLNMRFTLLTRLKDFFK